MEKNMMVTMVAWTIVLIASFDVALSQWFSLIGLLKNATLIMIVKYLVLISAVYATYSMLTMKHK